MEKTALTPEFIAFMSVLFYFQSPGGLGMSDEIWWFIIPAITAQFISMAIKTVEMSVGPTTWKKLEEHAKMAMRVASIFEMIAIHQMSLMLFSDNFWAMLFVNWFCIGSIGVLCVIYILDVAKGGKMDQVETGAVKNQI